MNELVRDQGITEDAFGITSNDIIEIKETRYQIKKMIDQLEALKKSVLW
jgi:hypothetical protein